MTWGYTITAVDSVTGMEYVVRNVSDASIPGLWNGIRYWILDKDSGKVVSHTYDIVGPNLIEGDGFKNFAFWENPNTTGEDGFWDHVSIGTITVGGEIQLGEAGGSVVPEQETQVATGPVLSYAFMEGVDVDRSAEIDDGYAMVIDSKNLSTPWTDKTQSVCTGRVYSGDYLNRLLEGGVRLDDKTLYKVVSVQLASELGYNATGTTYDVGFINSISGTKQWAKASGWRVGLANVEEEDDGR
jgi:hypothetical protein